MPSLVRITAVYKPVQLSQSAELFWHLRGYWVPVYHLAVLGIVIMLIALHIPVCSYLYNGPSSTLRTFCSARLFWADFYMCVGVNFS